MDAYNANPTSMTAALKNFAAISHPRKVLILGDMLELGSYAREEHQKIADLIKNEDLCSVFLVGSHFSSVDAASAIKFENSTQLAGYLASQKPLTNSLILIKGSRGIQLEKVLEKLDAGQGESCQ
jgi:UDP-N-acetylmuramoyl-tripeptide--D-alanyl-D-alanine ligase